MCMSGCSCEKCEKESSINISVVTNRPAPPRLVPRRSVEDKVRELVETVDLGHGSMVEWGVLTKLYKALCGCKQTPRVVNLKKLISPILRKYGYYGSIEE